MNNYIRQRIDREDEITLLQQIVSGEILQRILLIKANAGMGKTELLSEFFVNRRSDKAIYAVIDFKNEGISQANFLYKICESLGWHNFPKLENILNDLLELPSINVSDNVLIGRNKIALLLGNLDKQDKESYLAVITKSFFEDIRRLGRVVLIVDTYEKADPTVKAWLTNIFLHYGLNSDNLVCVISGQHIPEPTIDWAGICHIIELQGIEAIHWYKYAQSEGISVTLEWIEGCCYASEGYPLRMAQILSSFMQRKGK